MKLARDARPWHPSDDLIVPTEELPPYLVLSYASRHFGILIHTLRAAIHGGALPAISYGGAFYVKKEFFLNYIQAKNQDLNNQAIALLQQPLLVDYDPVLERQKLVAWTKTAPPDQQHIRTNIMPYLVARKIEARQLAARTNSGTYNADSDALPEDNTPWYLNSPTHNPIAEQFKAGQPKGATDKPKVKTVRKHRAKKSVWPTTVEEPL